MRKEIGWSVYPARRDRSKFVLFVISFILTLLFLYFAGGFFWMLFGAVVLLISLYPFYVKTEYEASTEGIKIKRPFYRKKRRWSEFRRIKEYENGVLLSPYKKDSFLENFRGEFLFIESKDKEKVVKVLKELLNEYYTANKDS